jgi:hypothetical protein
MLYVAKIIYDIHYRWWDRLYSRRFGDSHGSTGSRGERLTQAPPQQELVRIYIGTSGQVVHGQIDLMESLMKEGQDDNIKNMVIPYCQGI